MEGLGNKRRLCSVLKDNSKFSSVGVTLGLVISMVLAVLGVFLTTFEFVFQGVAGLALGDAKTRAYSPVVVRTFNSIGGARVAAFPSPVWCAPCLCVWECSSSRPIPE